tara:strand:- start:341 stop:1147 length:807 start_codon:yes stop_codon:yes gene_type:complete
MKLLLENWREYLNEQVRENVHGVVTRFEKDYTIDVALVDLNSIKEYFKESQSIEELAKKLESKEFYNKAIVGYIHAGYNPMYSKAHSTMGGSGGLCSNTYSVRQSIGRGHGESLYNALLGFAAMNDVYITADRHSVSAGASKRWSQIDAQTDDEVPGAEDPYIGTFDNYKEKETDPIDDDCVAHDNVSLDKGYKDQKQIDFYKELKYNLDSFFEEEILSLFEDPGFWGKLFGNTPRNKAEKLKKQLLRLGRNKFHDWELKALENPELR